MAKDFKKNPTQFFVNDQPDEIKGKAKEKKSTAPVPEIPEGFKPPLGYTLRKERKSKVFTLQVSPRVFNAINKLTEESGLSRNEYLNEVLWNYLMDKGVLEDNDNEN